MWESRVNTGEVEEARLHQLLAAKKETTLAALTAFSNEERGGAWRLLMAFDELLLWRGRTIGRDGRSGV